MASSRLTSLNENTSTYGNGTRDYTSLATWEAATDNDLVTAMAGERLECYPDAEFNDSIILLGATTSADYFRTITCAPGNEPNGIFADGVIFRRTSGNTIFSISENNAGLYDLSCGASLNSASTIILISTGNTSTRVVGVVVDEAVNSGAGGITGISINSSGNGAVVANCGVFNCESFGISIGATGASCYVYNCTAVGNNKGIAILAGTELGLVKNCLASDNTTYDFGTEGVPTFNPNSDYNASSDTSAPGDNSRVSQTFTFVDALNNDYHLDESDAGALDFGTDLSADANFAFDDDVDLDTRSGDWDIGFDEFVVGGGGGSGSSSSIITICRRRRR